jgi:hypothetical protein
MPAAPPARRRRQHRIVKVSCKPCKQAKASCQLHLLRSALYALRSWSEQQQPMSELCTHSQTLPPLHYQVICALTCSTRRCTCMYIYKCAGNFAAGQCKYTSCSWHIHVCECDALGDGGANIMQRASIYLARSPLKVGQFPGCDLFEYEMSLIPRISDK